MTQNRIICILLCACAVATLLTGCGNRTGPEQSQPPAPPPTADSPAPSAPEQTEPPAQGRTATLYVGTKESGFAEYPLEYEGELTPELLIQGIADLTGWNLTLAGEVTSGKGGMSVCLSGESALYVGPPDPQKDEFHT